MGKRDQYPYWKIADTHPEELNLIETPGDPEAGPIPRKYLRTMVLGTDWIDLRDGIEYGFDAAAVIEVDGELLAGRFGVGEPARSVEGELTQAHIALGIGQEALSATVALARPDNTLLPVETWRMDSTDVQDGVPGVPYTELRERFPQAVWL